MVSKKVLLTIIILLTNSCLGPLSVAFARDVTEQINSSTFSEYKITKVAEGLSYPWSLAFLSAERFLVTERTGQLRLVNSGEVSSAIAGLPHELYVKSQGGLLDVVLHPNYKENGWIYLSYASGTAESNALAVMRAKLVGLTLVEQQVLFRVSPTKNTPVHFGGRMAFLPDNSLLITSGDGFDFREQAQLKTSLLGKIIRIMDDGSVPSDNPFVDLGEAGPISSINDSELNLEQYIYSLGHRNPQGIVYDRQRNMVFADEHGPAGGDEVNIIQKGYNYGWPVITNGLDYSGARISPFTTYPGMEQPWYDWTPSIAPSSIAVYRGEMFSGADGDLLVTSLKFKQLYWLKISENKVVAQYTLFSEIGERLRDISVHPDGSLYLLTDSPQGKILKITTAK